MKESWAMRRGVGLCSLGRPNGLFGPCQGAFAMMYDDWGLASGEFPTGGNEADICPVTLAGLPCQNVPYYTAAMAFYQQATTLIDLVLGSAHRRLVAVTVGATPPLMASDTEFYMSFTGETAGFTMLTPSSDVDFMVWQTTPFIWPTTYGVGYGFRRACYLGYSGC